MSAVEVITLNRLQEGVAVLQMKDVTHRNTFTEEFINQFLEKIRCLAAWEDLKAVILQGLPDIFSAGASRDSLEGLSGGKFSIKDLVLSEAIINIPVPVIAAMEGGALGGGFVIGLCCDMVVMGERSMYGVNFTDLGFTPGMGCTRLLEGLVGPFIAREMMFTGRMYKGRSFKEKGLINAILPGNEVFAHAIELAGIIAEKPRITLEILKYTLNMSKRKLLLEARVHEDLMHKISFSQPEISNRIGALYHRIRKDDNNINK